MADPIYDEDSIRGLLSVPISVDNYDMLQAGAVQALIDLYDRKVTREEFCNGVALSIPLYGQCSKMWLLDNIKGVFENGLLDKAAFEQASKGIEGVIRKQAEQVIELVKRLQECPTSLDKVH